MRMQNLRTRNPSIDQLLECTTSRPACTPSGSSSAQVQSVCLPPGSAATRAWPDAAYARHLFVVPGVDRHPFGQGTARNRVMARGASPPACQAGRRSPCFERWKRLDRFRHFLFGDPQFIRGSASSTRTARPFRRNAQTQGGISGDGPLTVQNPRDAAWTAVAASSRSSFKRAARSMPENAFTRLPAAKSGVRLSR
jgi:hypothetical protein